MSMHARFAALMCSILVMVGATLLLLPSSSAGAPIRFSPGWIETEQGHSLTAWLSNPTSEPIKGTTSMIDPDPNNFANQRATAFTVDPGEWDDVARFSCPDGGPRCRGALVITVSSAKAVFTATYFNDPGVFAFAHAGDWRRIS